MKFESVIRRLRERTGQDNILEAVRIGIIKKTVLMIKTKKAIAEVVRLDGPVLNEGVEDKKIRDLPLEESK